MSSTPLPTSKDVRDVLEGLLGREVEILNDYEHIDPAAEFGASVAVYVDELQRMQALIVMDFEMTAFTGAALALMPPQAAQTVINEGSMPDTYVENTYEVLNVMASLFNADGAPHLKIYLMYVPGEALPPDLDRAVKAWGNRRDVGVKVEGYGTGRLGLIVVA